MKYISIVFWMGILFILRCSKDLADVLFRFSVGFHLEGHPQWSSLLTFNREDLYAPFYYLSKTGHFVGFGFLSLLLSRRFCEKKAFFFALAYAVLTEILQLYFGRDGRLVDVGIDGCGIIAFLLLKRLGSVGRKANRKPVNSNKIGRNL